MDPETSQYTPIFRETATLPLDVAEADYLTFDLSGKQVELTDGTYAFLIGSDLEDNDLDNEPQRFRLAVHVGDTTAGYFEIRREGLFGVDPVLGAPTPRPGVTVPPNVIGPQSREPVFFLQATVPSRSPDIVGLDYPPGGGTFTIQYQAEPGLAYTVRRSSDLSVELAEWTLLPATEVGDGGVMSYTDAPPAGSAHYYVLTSVSSGKRPDPLPLLDFESGAPGWTTANPGGTATEWELGVENHFSLGAMSGVNVWATDLNAGYLPNTRIVLRSPEIDLSGYDRATLHWAQVRFFDYPSDDVGYVNVEDLTTDTSHTLYTAVSPTDEPAWETMSVALPSSVMGQVVRIEFVFEDDGIDQFGNSPGWLIDDVAVTVCP